MFLVWNYLLFIILYRWIFYVFILINPTSLICSWNGKILVLNMLEVNVFKKDVTNCILGIECKFSFCQQLTIYKLFLWSGLQYLIAIYYLRYNFLAHNIGYCYNRKQYYYVGSMFVVFIYIFNNNFEIKYWTLNIVTICFK